MRAARAVLAATVLLLASNGIGRAQASGSAEKASTDEAKRSPKTYRLLYTITETDGAKRLGVQHFAMTVNPDTGTAEIKMGSKVPIATGNYSMPSSAVQTQFTYVDVGLNIAARTQDFANGVQVYTKVEQSSVAESTNSDVRQPVIRQANLQNTALLTAGKPVMLGSLDVPGSTRHLDIEVVMEVVR